MKQYFAWLLNGLVLVFALIGLLLTALLLLLTSLRGLSLQRSCPSSYASTLVSVNYLNHFLVPCRCSAIRPNSAGASWALSPTPHAPWKCILAIRSLLSIRVPSTSACLTSAPRIPGPSVLPASPMKMTTTTLTSTPRSICDRLLPSGSARAMTLPCGLMCSRRSSTLGLGVQGQTPNQKQAGRRLRLMER